VSGYDVTVAALVHRASIAPVRWPKALRWSPTIRRRRRTTAAPGRKLDVQHHQ